MNFRKILARKRRGVTGRSFTIAMFMSALGLSIPLVNLVTPFVQNSPSTSTVATDPNFWINGKTGANVTISPSGVVNGSSSVTSGGTTLIFGDFYAALKFITGIVAALALPGTYVYSWIVGAGGPLYLAAGVAAVFQALVWASYALDYFYIFANRQLAQQ